MLKNLKEFIKNMSFKYKIIFMNIVSIVLCSIIIIVFSYSRISKYLIQNAYNDRLGTVDQAANYITEKFTNLVKQSQAIIEDDSFRKTEDEILWNENYNYAAAQSNIQKIFEQVRIRDSFFDYFYFYTENGSFTDAVAKNIDPEDFKNSDIFKELKRTGLIVWKGSKDKDISNKDSSITYALSVPTNRPSVDTILLVSLKDYPIQQYLQSLNKTDNSTTFIIDNDFNIVLSDYNNEYTSIIKNEDFRHTIVSDNNGFLNMKIGNSENVVTFSALGNIGWKVVNVEPSMYFASGSRYFKNLLLVIAIVSVVISLIFSYFLTSTLIKPLKKLTKKINEVKQGSLSTRFHSTSKDEIGELGNNFNDMLDKINKLIIDIKKEQNDKRKIEIDLLQSQINPHFLYNTLDSIYWKAMLGENKIVGNMIIWLSRMMRIGLSKGRDKIPIKEEIEHVENYLKLQKTVYDCKFDYIIQCNEMLYEYNVVKIILQPLVENCIIHAFNNMEGKGFIDIKVYSVADDILFEVKDNGCGMGELSKGTHGYALENTRKRLMLNYGESYGINIVSNDDGCKVIVKIPKER